MDRARELRGPPHAAGSDSAEQLDWRPDERSISVRETVHHLVEANVVAASIVIAAQVEPLPDGLARTVRLLDQPGAELRTVSVAEVLPQEASHAREHIEELRGLRGGRVP